MAATSGSGLRLPKAERIRKRAEYLRLQTQGRRLLTPSFIVFTLWSDEAPLRLGITVSRRVGGAVVRNRVKRLLREAFRHHKERFPRGLQLVIVAKAHAAQLDYQRVCAELLELSRRCSPRT